MLTGSGDAEKMSVSPEFGFHHFPGQTGVWPGHFPSQHGIPVGHFPGTAGSADYHAWDPGEFSSHNQVEHIEPRGGRGVLVLGSNCFIVVPSEVGFMLNFKNLFSVRHVGYLDPAK